MEYVFLKVLNMSISATWLVLAVLVLRLFFKKAPKALTVLLWALVGIRLLCPFTIESIFSLIPSAETVPAQIMTAREPAIQTGISSINAFVNPILSETLAPEPLTSVNPMQLIVILGWNIWVLGMLCMLLFSAISYLRLRLRVRVALRCGNHVYECDQVHNPFILGIFRPRIYLPSGMPEAQRQYVLAHENAHLKRRDHWWKPLGFLLLTVHWFNPLLWVAYCLLCRDIEFACDEKVIRDMDPQQKKGYSEALVACSMQRRMVMACPLAFGEVGVKERIKSVLHYKKPAFWIVLVALILCIAVAVAFLTDPVSQPQINDLTADTIYEYTQSPDLLSPTLRLYAADHSFQFTYSSFSSYIAMGTFRLENERLILSTSDDLYTYIFDKQGDSYVFDAGSSSPIPQYQYAEGILSPVPDGAVFTPIESSPSAMPPPSLLVTCADHSVDAWRGTYNWEIPNADGTTQYIQADSSHPLACLDTVAMLPLIPSAISAIDPHQAVLTFSQTPQHIEIRRYTIDHLAIATGIADWEKITCTDNRFSLSYGLYLYEITATFDSAGGKGTATYAFYTSIPTIESIDQEEFGLRMDVTVQDGNKVLVTFTHDQQAAAITGRMQTGEQYDILAYHDGEWLTLEHYMRHILGYDYAATQFVFTDETYEITSGGTLNLTHDLSIHGTLPPGNYRLCKTVTLDTVTGVRISKFYTADFAIVD